MFPPSPLPRTLEASFRDLGSTRWATRVSSVRDVVRHALRNDGARTRALPLLERLVREDLSSSVRSEAALALADLHASDALPTLLLAVEDDDELVRQMAITALGEIGDPRASARLGRALGDPRPEVRYQAVIAFTRVARDHGDVRDALARAMSDADPAIRYIALRVAEERLLEADANPMPAQSADAPPNELPGLARAALGDPRLVARAREIAGSQDAAAAVAAGLYLSRLGHPDGFATVVSVVRGARRTPEVEDERACVERAGELLLREAIPDLERRAWGARPWVRTLLSFGRGDAAGGAWLARTALARMGHPRACAEILHDLDSRSRGKRTAALIAAGQAKLCSPSGPPNES
ncbi:MAG: HEAT repeat domain-containing protein [Polyangiaceae bacterium]